jgi:hypothetical protein
VKTVGDLIQRLQDFDPSTPVIVSGVDCGGYNAAWKDDFDVTGYPNAHPNGIVRVDGAGNDTDDFGRVI